MGIEFGLTTGPFNTKYAPLAALGWHFRAQEELKPLEKVQDEAGNPEFSLADELIQVLISILANCEYICEVNSRLRSERKLAQPWGFERYLEQSSLAVALNQLNRMKLSQLEQAVQMIWCKNSRALGHDWRGLLWFDLDLSGLICGKAAEGSEKGYFSGKKTLLDANLHGSVRLITEKRSAHSCFQVPNPVPSACNRWWKEPNFYSI